jgi:hypothetical protein
MAVFTRIASRIAQSVLLRAGRTGFDFRLRSQRQSRFWGTTNLLSNGYRVLFTQGLWARDVKLTIRRLKLAEVKKMWIYTSTPPYAFKCTA